MTDFLTAHGAEIVLTGQIFAGLAVALIGIGVTGIVLSRQSDRRR